MSGVPQADIERAVLIAEPTFFLDESRRLRTVWRFLIFGAGFVIAQLAIGIVGGIVGAVWLIVTQGPEAFNDLELVEAQLEQYTPHIMVVASLPTTAVMLAWVIICRKYLDRRSVASMGIVRPGMRSVIVGFLVGLLPIVAAGGVVAAAGGFSVTGIGFSTIAGFLVPTLILMAFMEEVIFRSYLLQNLLDIRRPVFGVIFTSLFFWFAHALNPHVWSSVIIPVNMFGAGVILALAYMLSRNIWFPTALHFGWNLAQGVLLSLPISGMTVEGLIQLQTNDAAPVWLTGGKFGLEGSVAVTVAELLMICGLVLLVR
ncbi:MAG: CPBP family intramembrane metalloprotease, partial [Pirellulaceae bacterium]|nr:CPBP family intramembrane metalloprotease [Pirellulaceae bacterium]